VVPAQGSGDIPLRAWDDGLSLHMVVNT